VGYVGGVSRDPTHPEPGETECVQVDFDPARISYAELLEVFWKTPNLCDQDDDIQYRSGILTHNERQQKLALACQARRSSPSTTVILPLTTFRLAESYDQKFKLRQEPELLREFEVMYPDASELIASTAAARVNGYLGGYGSDAALQDEIGSFGLSTQGRATLLELRKHRPKLEALNARPTQSQEGKPSPTQVSGQ
jgi:hypothetical protein